MSSKTISLKVPEVGFIAGTRFALGMGVGLLAAGKMGRDKRELTGWTLVAAGVISTVVIAKRIIGRTKRPWYLAA
jgi:multisubunit Na+/H+ antiporter MnhB subunit